MRSYTVIGAACVLVCLAAASLASGYTWKAFKQTHGKRYNSTLDEVRRRSIFELNKARVSKFNSEHSDRLGYKQGLSHLSDWTDDELAKLNGLRPELYQPSSTDMTLNLTSFMSLPNLHVPDAVDWRKVPGRVSGVKNQGQCGSCWAFSATGALEGTEQYVKAKGSKLVPLSEQDLVDCSKENFGCDGGLPTLAFSFVRKVGGIDDEQSYPYVSPEKSECHYSKNKSVMSDMGHFVLEEGNEELLKTVVANYGPVSVGIEATGNFQAYEGGVLNDEDCGSDRNSLNHGVLVVGYGTDPKHGDFWIVKNSWGASWGEKGYVRMSRNKKNQCGIATLAAIPLPVPKH